MSATDELRRLLDERGVEYEARTSPIGGIWTYWDAFNGHRVYARDNENGTVKIFGEWDVTPEQAIAATLGHYNAVRYVGLRHGEYWERTENGDYYCGGCGWKVTDHDSYCPECGGALHEYALGAGTCHDKGTFNSWGLFTCSNCSIVFPIDAVKDAPSIGRTLPPNFCPHCGARVVSE